MHIINKRKHAQATAVLDLFDFHQLSKNLFLVSSVNMKWG